MFTVETENIQGYVDAPRFLTERQSTYIALIADNGNRFLSYGIVEGTILFVDLEIEYTKGELSCFVNKKKEFKLSETELDGYEYVGRIVAARNEFEV